MITDQSNDSSAIKIDEINILRLEACYSPVNLPINGTSDEMWDLINHLNETNRNESESVERYECKLENCDSFLGNSKVIKGRKFYPRTNSEWGSFFLSETTNETLRLELAEPFKLVSGRDYKIELFYFVTENVRLRLFTSANRKSSIISLYPTYSYLSDKEHFKYLPVSINLRDLVPFNVNSVQAGFSILIRTDIRPTNRSAEYPPMAAISNIRILNFSDFGSQKLTDFLAHWRIHGERASNEWTCLVDQTSFYSGEQNYDLNNISITFYAPKFRSQSTYLLLSKWSAENRERFEIKATTELNSSLLIETIGERLQVIKSQRFELNPGKENIIHYKVLENNLIESLTKNPTKNLTELKKRVIRFKLSFILRNDDDQPKKITISSINYGDPCGQHDSCMFAKNCFSRSSTEYRCECLPGYHGKACEWLNRCADPAYCELQNGSCTPIGDSFKCNCAEGSFWLNDRKICQSVPFCFSKPHLRNEQCVYEYDYKTNHDCNENQTFTCNRLFEPSYTGCLNQSDSSCQTDKEKTVTSLSSSLPNTLGSFCVCNRENGFIESETTNRCVQLTNQTQNPFLKQYLSCSQTYKFSFFQDPDKNNFSGSNETKTLICKPECACWPGFELDGNCRPVKQCTLACGENQFCGFDENGNQTCLCAFGYFGDCKSNFCEQKANDELIRKFCGPFGCKVANLMGQKKFVCNCAEELYEKNLTTG